MSDAGEAAALKNIRFAVAINTMIHQTKHLPSHRKLQAEGKVQKDVGKGKDVIRDATRR